MIKTIQNKWEGVNQDYKEAMTINNLNALKMKIGVFKDKKELTLNDKVATFHHLSMCSGVLNNLIEKENVSTLSRLSCIG